MRRRNERGQVLPLWAFGAITTFALMFLAINYANAVRFQIRAQNAAESAAQAMVAIQSQKFNLTNIMMYATDVEEYRLRKNLDGMMLATAFSGGCQPGLTSYTPPVIATGVPSPLSCNAAYQGLRSEFLQSTNRYSADAVLLNDVVTNNTYTNWTNDAKALLLNYGAGTTACASGQPAFGSAAAVVTGDCRMTYRINAMRERSNLQAVQQDAQILLIPGLGNTSSLPNDQEAKELWAPVEVDVTTCAAITPIIPNFGPIHLPTTYAVGRAAEANVMVEEDWLQPGSINDPARGGSGSTTPFQPLEEYASSTGADEYGSAASTFDWYATNFGGNVTYAYGPQAEFDSSLATDELSARVGWWNAVPETPFGSNVTIAGACP